MATPSQARQNTRFGVYEVDFRAGELRKNGLKVKIQEQPFQVLAALLERPGDIVPREELRTRLWPGDTYVEFDHSLTVAIGRLRETLDDSADNPIFIETLPRRGYRFIAPVEKLNGAGSADAAKDAVPSQSGVAAPASRGSGTHGALGWVVAVIVTAVLASTIYLIDRRTSTRLQSARHQPAGSRIMLAVLPFQNLSGDAHQEYVSDAMTEELITHLGRLDPQGLGVIARTSVMKYKNSSSDVKQIGRDLGVSYVLEGSVRRGRSQIDVTAQLIQASDQTHLWAETYERPLADVFAIERDVTQRIAESLSLKLFPEREAALARAETIETAAYEAYLQGRSAWEEGTEAGFDGALTFFQQAVSRDPHYAMAYAGLGETYLSLGDYHFVAPEEADRKAAEAISRGLGADPSIPELYVLRAAVLSRQTPAQTGAEEAYRRALELNPSDARAHGDYALYLRDAARLPEAQREIDQAVVLDPLSPNVHMLAAWVLLSADRLDDAQSHLERALQLNPEYPAAMYFMARVNERRNRPGDAILWYEKAVSASGRTPKYLHALGIAYAKAGRKDEARRLLDELKNQAKRRYVAPDYVSSLQAQLGVPPEM